MEPVSGSSKPPFRTLDQDKEKYSRSTRFYHPESLHLVTTLAELSSENIDPREGFCIKQTKCS